MTFGSLHPGETLREELAARATSVAALSRKLHIPPQRLRQIIRGQRPITPMVALRLARHFGNEAEFWTNLQTQHELATLRRTQGERINGEVEEAT